MIDGVSSEDDGTIGDRIVQWEIEKAKINTIPSQISLLSYDGSVKSPTWNNYDPTQLLVSGTTSAVEAGSYTVHFTPNKNFTWADGSTNSKETTWAIQKATISAVPSAQNVLSYDGSVKSPTWNNYDPDKLSISGNTSAVEAGNYTVYFTPTKNFMWTDGSSSSKAVQWAIAKTTLGTAKTPSPATELTYTGSEQSPSWNNYNQNVVTILEGSQIKAINAGTYSVTFSLINGYEWEDGTTTPKSVSWAIKRAIISSVPLQSNSLIYDGTTKTPTWRNYDSNQLTIGGTTQATAQGTYNATFTPKANYQWSDGSTAAKTISWIIGSPTTVAAPTVAAKLTYTGAAQSPTWNDYDSTRLTIGGTSSATNAGIYSATFTPKSGFAWVDGSTSAKTVSWTIDKASLAIPTVTNTSFSYDGNSHTPVIGSYNTNLITVTGNTAQTSVGTYTITFALKNSTNYQWSDGTNANVSKSWTINKASLSTPTVTNTSFSYDGNSHTPTIGSYNTDLITVTGNTAQTNAGSYTITFALKNSTNSQWSDGSTSAKTVSWTINKASLSVPTVSNTNLTYSGNSQAPVIGSYNTNLVTVTGNTAQTNAGSYTITFSLKSSTNSQWSDGSTSAKNVSWTIEKASLAIPTITNTSIDYDGNGHAPVISSYNGNLITVTGNVPQTNAGSYTVVCSLKSNTNSQWSDGTTADVSTPWTIRKATVEVPTVSNTSFEQDGESHAPTISSYNTNAVTVTGNAAQTEAGTYTITFALKDKTNYQWLDGTTENISVEWEITYSTFYSSVGMLKSNTMRFGTDVFVLAES